MQISTHITTPKERTAVFADICNNYKVANTDKYLTALGDSVNLLTKGAVAEIRSIDLGELSKTRRVKSLEAELTDDTDKILSIIREVEEKADLAEDRLPEIKEELDGVEKELASLKGRFKDFIGRIAKNKNLQDEFSKLNRRRNKLISEVNSLEELIRDRDAYLESQINAYFTKKESIEAALVRESKLHKIESDRIEQYKKTRETLVKKYTELEEHISLKKREYKHEFIEKIRSKIIANERLNQFLEQRELYHTADLQKIEMRAIRLEIKKLDELISRIEDEHNSNGRLKEVYYLTQNFDKNGDLVCFSRRFRGDRINMESEMSHIPRVRVDQSESMKPMMILTGLLGLLVSLLLVTDLMGIAFDIINIHTAYLLGYVIFNFYYINKIQNKDNIFEAIYYFLESSKIDIPYVDKEGKIASIEVICYHMELLYSDKQNMYSLIQTTESDIIAAADTRHVNLIMSLQKQFAQWQIDEASYQKNVRSLTQQNQELVTRIEAIEKNVEADFMRKMKWKDQTRESRINTLGPDVIKYLGVTLVIYVAARVLDGMGPLIDIESGETGGFGFTFTFGIGFVLGVLFIMVLNRMQRTR